jgi:hypothetical protein
VIDPVSISTRQVLNFRRVFVMSSEFFGWRISAIGIVAPLFFVVTSGPGSSFGQLGLGILFTSALVQIGLAFHLGRKGVVTTTEISEKGMSVSRNGNTAFTNWETLGTLSETRRCFRFRLRDLKSGRALLFKQDFTTEQLAEFRDLLAKLELPKM